MNIAEELGAIRKLKVRTKSPLKNDVEVLSSELG